VHRESGEIEGQPSMYRGEAVWFEESDGVVCEATAAETVRHHVAIPMKEETRSGMV